MNNKKSKKKFIIILVLVLLLIICSILFLIKWLNSKSPKRVFFDSLSKVANVLKIEPNEFNTYKVSLNGKLDKKILSMDSIDIKVDMKNDNKNKLFDLLFKSNIDNTLFDIGLYMRDKNNYIGFSQLNNKLIEASDIGTNYDNIFGKIDNNSTDYGVIKSIYKALDFCLKDEYFERYKERIVLNGKSKKVTANKLNINSKNSVVILKDFVNKLVNDKKFINAIKKYGVSKSNLEKIVNSNTKTNDINFTVYTSGFTQKFVAFKINFKIDKKDVSIFIFPINISNYNFTVEYDNTKYEGDINFLKKNSKRAMRIRINNSKINLEFKLVLDKVDNVLKNIDESDIITIDDISEDELLSIVQNMPILSSILNINLDNDSTILESDEEIIEDSEDYEFDEEIIDDSEYLTDEDADEMIEEDFDDSYEEDME